MITKIQKSLIVMLSVVLILPFSGCGNKSEQKESKNISASEAKSTTVYITKTGTKYHTENCYCLKKSKIKKKLSDLKDYEPCQICCPPVVKK